MSLIAVKGIPWKWSLETIKKNLLTVIKGIFKILNFEPGRASFKTYYLRLHKQDPIQVVERINKTPIGNGVGLKLTAFIPQHLPDIQLASKPKKFNNRRKNSTTLIESPQEVLKFTHQAVLSELQCKFPGLFNLSRKSGHKLLDEIACTVFSRLNHIMETNESTRQKCFRLSKTYRKTHPHFGDFQLILSTLHRLQDGAGEPRAQLLEPELCAAGAQPRVIDDLPYEKVQAACKKYTQRIIKKVSEHVTSLKTDISQTDGEEEIARKKVRVELKKMSPLIPAMIRQVFKNHFVPQKSDYIRMRIYGEPFLPGKEAMAPFIHGCNRQVDRIYRSQKMFNMITFNVPPNNYQSLIAMDGTVISGAKLVIRTSDTPRYEMPPTLMKELMASCGYHETEDSQLMDDVVEDWSEF